MVLEGLLTEDRYKAVLRQYLEELEVSEEQLLKQMLAVYQLHQEYKEGYLNGCPLCRRDEPSKLGEVRSWV